MSIKIIKEGFTFEVNTEAELRAVLSALNTKRQAVSINPRDFMVDTNILVELYKSIPPQSKTRKVLNLLKEKPNGVTKRELLTKLGLESTQALGGALGSIGRHARRLGVITDDIYKWEYVNDDDKYSLTDSMVEAINRAAGQTNGE